MSSSEEARRHFNLALIAIAFLCLIPRLLFATSQFVEYDGYWHVWIAQQDRWANFVREYQTNAHPPLYFLLLRLSFLLGRAPLTYRSVSLISGTASIYILGKTALKAMRSPIWAALAALSYGLALPSILISNEVRTYMLAAFLVQVSFYYFLDRDSMRSRILFAVTAALACLTEYYALIYAGAALLFALALPVVRRRLEIATFTAILALPVWEYLSHFGARSVAYDHLPVYYFQPGSGESALEFLFRNLRNEVNWFSPWQLPVGPVFYAAAGTIVVAVIAIVYLVRRASGPKNLPALAILLLPLIMMCAIMAGALMRAYPFGGFLRQQFILFPFLVVCPFLLLDRLLMRAPRTVTLAIAAVLAMGVTYVSVENYQAWPKVTGTLLTDQMARYNRRFPAPQAIYIDQFNLITFFMHHHDWNWEFVSSLPGTDAVDVYKVSRGTHSLLLFRDEDHWILDLREAQLFDRMARGMRMWHLSSTTIFCLSQPGGKTRTEAQVTGYRNRVAELTAAAGLCVQRLDIENYDVYAEFRTAGNCTTTQEAE
jgi:hypothetical protein